METVVIYVGPSKKEADDIMTQMNIKMIKELPLPIVKESLNFHMLIEETWMLSGVYRRQQGTIYKVFVKGEITNERRDQS